MNIGKMKKWSNLFVERRILIRDFKNVFNIDTNILKNNDIQKILKDLLQSLINYKISNVKISGLKSFDNISEYEFSLTKASANIEDYDKIDIYFQFIESHKIKESIFCYWSLIYDEECKKHHIESNDKVIITELEMKDYKNSILLEIEDNNTEILKYGTVVYFIDIIKYLENNINKNEDIIRYLKNINRTTLLIGIKLNNRIKSI